MVTHTFSEEWKFDESKHWHEATCEHKDQISGEGLHVDGDNDGKCDACGYQMVAPTPEPVTEVSEDEWMASFGLDKRYYIAENYSFKVEVKMNEDNYSIQEATVDGTKLKSAVNGKENGQVMPEFSYYYNDVDTEYEYYYKDGENWKKRTEQKNPKVNPMDTYAAFFSPYQKMSDFHYDAESKSYKLNDGLEKSVQPFGKVKDVSINFADKKISKISFIATNKISDTESVDCPLVGSFTYGGQIVTLPNVLPPLPGAAVYSYKINDSGYSTMEHDGEKNQWSIDEISVCKDDKITFANTSGSLAQPAILTGLYCEGETYGFDISNGVLTASEDGVYSFIISPEDNKDKITIQKHDSPIPETDCKLMGIKNDWEIGLTMLPTSEGSSEYVANNIDITAGDKLKVKFGDDWIETYKNGGYANALDENLVQIDDNKNIQFNFDGVFTIYFESNLEGQFGVFVKRDSVSCPYVGSADMTTPQGAIHQEASFVFHKVDLGQNFIEYYLSNCPGYNGMSYTIKNGDNPVDDFTLEEGGEKANFDKVGSTITYKGSAEALTFYLKEDLINHSLKIYVEAFIDPAKYNTLYLDVGDWANDGATFCAYFFDSTDKNPELWVMLDSEDGLYKVNKVSGYDKVIFVRCDPTKDPLVDHWDAKWNQTDDLDVPNDANVKCTITGWGEPGQNSTAIWGTK